MKENVGQHLLRDLRSLARLHVFLQGLEVLSNAVCVLAGEETAGETQESAKPVVHLVHEMGTAVLALGVRIRPRALQGTARELAGAPLRLHVRRLLHLDNLLEPAWKSEVKAVASALAGRSVV